MEHSSKRTTVLIAILGVLVVASGGILAGLSVFKQRDTFLNCTTCMAADISELTPAQVVDILEKKAEGMTITLVEDGEEALTGSAEEFGYHFDREATEEAMNAVMNAQKADTVAILRSIAGQDNEVPAAAQWTCDEEVFLEKVQKANLAGERIPSERAQLAYDEEKKRCVVQEAIYGNDFDETQFQDWMKENVTAALQEGDVTEPVSLEFPTEIYTQPDIIADDEYLDQRCEAKNAYAGAEVIYDVGDTKEVLDYATIMTWLDIEDGEATLDEKKVLLYVKKMKNAYDTLGRDRVFQSSTGEAVTIDAKRLKYGTLIDEEKEYEQLLADIKSRKTVEREPMYDSSTKFYSRSGADDLNGNYVEVSIPDQHVWLYVDGKLVIDTDCVTGDVKKKRGTTTGIYPIAFKKSPAVLRGGTGKNAYASPVTYWMPFNAGQGLHDATWRGRFGGSIYQGHGSHGCVNLPKKAAKEIYANVAKGFPVVVHN